MNNLNAVIIASKGEDTMKSNIPCVLHKICSKELIAYVADAVAGAGCTEIAAVYNGEVDNYKRVLGEKIKYVQCCSKDCNNCISVDIITTLTGDYTLVINGNMPLIKSETITDAVSFHISEKNSVTVVGENSECIYIFNSSDLKQAIESKCSVNDNNCVLLTEIISSFKAEKKGVFTISDTIQLKSVNDRVELNVAEKIIQKQINEAHMRNGVTIHAPETVFISPDAQIDYDSEIFSDVVIEKGCKIGKGVTITSASRLSEAHIEDKVSIQSSVVLGSEIGEETTVGPFAYVRPGCKVGKKVRIGDFVELKNCNIGDGTKVSHLTYVGDADVGSGCNFGCGTVTVNYDGKNKYRTVIGNNVFIGCNSNLIAPVTVNDGAYTAAGSTITDDVPENQLAIARARQINKSGWNDRRKK